MGVLSAWLAEIGLITWRDLTNKADKNHTISGFPLPADYLATFMVFGLLGLVPRDNQGASRAATAVAWGFVVATLVNALPAALNPSATTQTPAASSTVTAGG